MRCIGLIARQIIRGKEWKYLGIANLGHGTKDGRYTHDITSVILNTFQTPAHGLARRHGCQQKQYIFPLDRRTYIFTEKQLVDAVDFRRHDINSLMFVVICEMSFF